MSTAGITSTPSSQRQLVSTPPSRPPSGPRITKPSAAERKMPAPPAATLRMAVPVPRRRVAISSLRMVSPVFSSPPRPRPTMKRPSSRTSMLGANAPTSAHGVERQVVHVGDLAADQVAQHPGDQGADRHRAEGDRGQQPHLGAVDVPDL